MNSDIENGTSPEPAAPATTEASLNQAGVIAIIMQAIAALGILIGVMGAAENSWLRDLHDFASSSEAVPVIGLSATGIVWIVTWVRARRRSGKLAFAFAMLPNRVAQVKGPLHPKTLAAIEAAEAKLSPFERRY